MKIYEVEGKLKITWDAEARAIIDTWESYDISLDDFREAVLVRGLSHSKANQGRAWIVDSSRAKGTFSQKIQNYINSDIFPAFSLNGVLYFITIPPKTDPNTMLTVKQYQSVTGLNGLQLIEKDNVEEALLWLKENG